MNNGNIPDILSLARLSHNVTDLKTRLDTTRTEAVTGRYEDITAKTNGDIGAAHLLRKAIDDAKLSQSNLSLVESRAQITQTTLGNLGSEGSRIATGLLAAVGREDVSSVKIFSEDAKTSLYNTFASLNTKLGERALFGGDETDRAPLADADILITDIEAIFAGATDAADATAQLDFYFDDPSGGFATNIYQGGIGRAALIEIGPGSRIDVSAKADDPALKDIIRGLASVAALNSVTYADKDTTTKEAIGKVLDGDNDLVEQRAGIGVNESRVSAAKARYEAEETVLTSLFNAKTARDPYEAASELQLLETQLEASYLMTARMAQLSLANFLR